MADTANSDNDAISSTTPSQTNPKVVASPANTENYCTVWNNNQNWGPLSDLYIFYYFCFRIWHLKGGKTYFDLEGISDVYIISVI